MFGGVKIKKGAKVGKSNGLSMLLDAETFDYMFQVKFWIIINNYKYLNISGEGKWGV